MRSASLRIKTFMESGGYGASIIDRDVNAFLASDQIDVVDVRMAVAGGLGEAEDRYQAIVVTVLYRERGGMTNEQAELQ